MDASELMVEEVKRKLKSRRARIKSVVRIPHPKLRILPVTKKTPMRKASERITLTKPVKKASVQVEAKLVSRKLPERITVESIAKQAPEELPAEIEAVKPRIPPLKREVLTPPKAPVVKSIPKSKHPIRPPRSPTIVKVPRAPKPPSTQPKVPKVHKPEQRRKEKLRVKPPKLIFPPLTRPVESPRKGVNERRVLKYPRGPKKALTERKQVLLPKVKEKEAVKRRDVGKERVKILTKISEGEVSVGEEGVPELRAEDVLEKLLPILKGKGREFNLQRPLCLIAVGKSVDGLRMVEHLMATKYTYHGEYGFFMGLPWQKELMLSEIAKEKLRTKDVPYIPESAIREIGEEDPYSLITSERLIVRIPSVNEENKLKIIRGLREISKRGPKCVILYTPDVTVLENLDKEVLDIDVLIVALPECNEKLPGLIEKLLGIDLPLIMEMGVDDLWSSAVRIYEEELERLDDELPTKGVDFFPERESSLHYLMKRLVYWYLKRSGRYADVRVEQLEPLIDERNQFVGYVVPDIVADGEYWEIETGYPSKEEMELIKEPWSPQARLIWKLLKYKGNPEKIRVVLPTIYAHLFRHDIRKIKRYFEDRGINVIFYTIHLRGKGSLRIFM